MELLLG
jgi:hypothetical protein